MYYESSHHASFKQSHVQPGVQALPYKIQQLFLFVELTLCQDVKTDTETKQIYEHVDFNSRVSINNGAATKTPWNTFSVER